MILDLIDHADPYRGISPGIATALDYLRTTDFDRVIPGRIEIDGPRVFALVSDYDTKPVEHGVWEAHRRHVDVQYVHSGEERVGHAQLSTLDARPYDDERDVLFAEGAGEFLTLGERRFAVFFPHDAHMPGLAIRQPIRVRKVVVKVRIPDAR